MSQAEVVNQAAKKASDEDLRKEAKLLKDQIAAHEKAIADETAKLKPLAARLRKVVMQIGLNATVA